MTGFERAGGIGSPQHVEPMAGLLICRADCAVDARFVRIIMQAAHAKAELPPPPPPPKTCDDNKLKSQKHWRTAPKGIFSLKITEKR